MIALWLIAALVLAIAVARFHKSNKLFWVAFTSLAVGIAAESLINRVSRDENVPTQVQPTQVVVDTPNYYSFLADVPPTILSPVPNPVSQVTTPGSSEDSIKLSKAHKETIPEPPEQETVLRPG